MAEEMRFYKCLPQMKCYAGDTLKPFAVYLTKNEDRISVSTGQTMKVTIADVESPTVAVLTKEAELVDGKFVVRITSDDTSRLNGDYSLLFSLYDADGLVYRKVEGKLHVIPAPKE